MDWARRACWPLVLLLMARMLPAQTEAEKGGDAYAERKKVDPIDANGAIFVDWPKPDVALVFSGEQDGYLEPCGCAGLENQKGGLRRRFTLLKELRDKGWPVVAMDLGGQEKRFGVQAEIKFDFALRALAKLGYAAVGFGEQDLRMDLLSIVINLDEATNPLVSANVGIVDFDSGFTKRYQDRRSGRHEDRHHVGARQEGVAHFKNSSDLTLLEPYQAIPRSLPKLREADCDHLVLLAYAEPDEAKDLARRFPEFDWVVTAHGADEPPNEPTKIEGTQFAVDRSRPQGHVRRGRRPLQEWPDAVPLPARAARSSLCRRAGNRRDARRVSEAAGDARLGRAGAEADRRMPSGGKFAGSKVCGDCHTIGDGGLHSHAPLPRHGNARRISSRRGTSIPSA